MRPLHAPLALLLCLAGCGGEASVEGADGQTSSLPAGYRRLASPELAPVREALEQGHGARALTLLERLQGFEAGLLRARAQFLVGDPVAALAEVEEAQRHSPQDPEGIAVEIELLAAMDRLHGAAELLEPAVRRSGRHPALLRAQGVIELRNSGHGREALAALERAQALDPELPFLRFPLAQAYLLAGRADLERAPDQALAKARAAERIWPGLSESLELEAEAHTGLLDFESALRTYAALEERGQDHQLMRARLEQRWSTRCLLEGDRPAAFEHAREARRLGLSGPDLGFAEELLADAKEEALERGVAAAQRSDWSAAQAEFTRALDYAPGDLEAQNHLAAAFFQGGDYRTAAERWSVLWQEARGRGIELPDPVPLHLARAWRLAGERGRARETLDTLLDLEPEGPWSAEARELLLALEAEELAGK